MTTGTCIFIIFIIIMALLAISLLVDLFFNLFPQGKECYIPVESIRTGEKYHASRYKFNRHNDLELYIYNHISYKYEWYPIWHFKNSFIIAMQIDKNYAIKHMYDMLLKNSAKDLTKDKK